ncbi:MAG: hypothetical protein WBC60_00065 [Cognaticolwellia sp.]
MRIIQLFLVFFLLFSNQLKATPNLFVHLNEITLKSNHLNLTISRDKHSDRVQNIEVKTQNKTFSITSKYFEQAYAVNLQNVALTQTIDLSAGGVEDYQLYIPYDLHSEDGSEPTEAQKFMTQELVIYFNNSQVKKVFTR